MAKTRAYKIAEELGIDRNELIEKARAVGIELKGPMVSLDDAEADHLRHRLGGKPATPVVEQRVETSTGGPVILRRKKIVAPPKPAEPEPAAVTTEPEPLQLEQAATSAGEEPRIDDEPGATSSEPPGADHDVARPSAATPDGGRAVAAADAPAATTEAARGAKQRKRVREVVNLREQDQITKQVTTRASLRRPIAPDPRAFVSPRRKRRDALAPVRPVAAKPGKRVVRVAGSITVGDLAHELGVKAPELQGRLMGLGTMAAITQAIDIETVRKIAAIYAADVQDVSFNEDEVIAGQEAVSQHAEPRPPIVTVMGHVDHGKTSLLDALRQTNVVAGEAGGITQHIGAYQAKLGERRITFIDTPGHEAFTMMRARGARVTDIVVLVVAATEGIMPQTVEAIAHARAAGVPIIVAVNKCDLPDANSPLVRQRLMEHGLVTEDFGGDVICVDVSALKRTGLEQLLEMIGLQADVLELRGDPTRRASGVVLEAQLDRGLGPVATVLVQDGTLRRGDAVVVGTVFGRVRVMQNEHGQKLDEAGPATPVQLVGLGTVPEAGSVFHVVESERDGKQIIDHRLADQRNRPAEAPRKVSLEDFFAHQQGEGPKTLAVVLKADVQGSLEAVRDALVKLSTDAVKVDVLHAGVGAVTEGDVMLARASGAIVVGFHVRPDTAARRAAEGQGVDVRTYQIIYELTDEVRRAMAGLLPPTVQEVHLGRAEVRRTFSVPRIGTIGGSYVLDGLIRRGAQARLVRDGVQIYDGRIGSLKRFKDDAREVATGFECGIGIDGYNDLKVGDVIEAYAREEKPATLE